MVRRHAGREAADGGVPAGVRASGATGEKVADAEAELRVTGGAPGDRDRPGEVPARLRGVHPEGVHEGARRQLDRRDTRRQRPLHRRGEVRRDGRRAQGVMAVGFSTFAFNGALLGVGCRGLLDLLNMYSERLETEGPMQQWGWAARRLFFTFKC